MIYNTRSRQLVERDYSIGSRQAWPNRFLIPKNWLYASYPLNGNANAEIWTNATATNVTWVNSERWYQAQMWAFVTNAYVLPPSNLINNLNTFSLSIRCKRNGNANTWDGKIFDYRSASNYVYIANNNSPANINFGISFWTAFNFTITEDFTSKRVHFVIAIDWWTCRIYRDWNLLTSWACWSTARTSTNGRIGNEWNAGANRYFNGNIALVKCYNRAVSPKEVQLLYKEWLKLLH